MKKTLIATALLTLVGATTAFATWGPTGTVWVSSTQGYTKYSSIYSNKTTASTGWKCEVYQKTMWSKPEGKLVNSDSSTRSNSMSLPVGLLYGSGNTGTAGYTYYIAIKPNWSQTGNDSIKLDIDAE